MRELIIETHRILNLIKSFTAGYSTTVKDQMIIDYKDKRYMVTFEELCNVEDEEMIDTMNKYWK